jgi:hypothetical protein
VNSFRRRGSSVPDSDEIPDRMEKMLNMRKGMARKEEDSRLVLYRRQEAKDISRSMSNDQ